MSNITDILNILGLSATEYATICSTLQCDPNKSLIYSTKILKKAMTILTKELSTISATNFKQHYNQIVLFFILAKNHPKMDSLFQVKIINKLRYPLYNNVIHQSKEFIKLILSMNYNSKYDSIINYINFIRTRFTKQEILDIFGKNVKHTWLYDYNNSMEQRKEWLPYFLTNYVNQNCIIDIYNYDKNIDYKLYLQIEKFQNNQDITYLICNPLVNDTLIVDIFEKTRIELINEMCLLNIVFSKPRLEYIATLDTTKLVEKLYLKIIREKVWENDKRYSTELFIIAFECQFYTIIIDHLNKNIPIDNINKYIAVLFVNKNYKNIEQVLKNCGTYNMLEILDHLYSRKIFDTTFCEFCINYISKENINLNLLKKFFRLNTYIKDLDRFSVPYDENLYKLCYNYNIYPDEYMNKLKDVKLDVTLKIELEHSRYKILPNSIYTLLKAQLFKYENQVLHIDDIILNYINNYLGI